MEVARKTKRATAAGTEGGSLPSVRLASTRFRLVRRLGAGGSGTVYEAFDTQRRSAVALKHLEDASALAVARVRDELELMSGVQHPNVARLYEHVRLEGDHVLIMELISGTSVLRHLGVVRSPEGITRSESAEVSGCYSVVPSRGPGADPHRAARVMLELARGLAALHQAGRLHRDIKPSNVLVEDHTGRAVLIDFGLVVSLAEAAHPRRSIAGTPEYMSPEQALGQPLSPASDWYAFGAVLYEALTGRRPFGGGVRAVLTAKAHVDPPPPSVLADVPPPLDDLCQCLLRRCARERPPAHAILETLASIADHRGDEP